MDAIIEAFHHYYGLDWLAMVSGLWGMHLLALKNRLGFLLSMVACISGFCVAALSSQYGFIAYNTVLIALMARGFIHWGRPERLEQAAAPEKPQRAAIRIPRR